MKKLPKSAHASIYFHHPDESRDPFLCCSELLKAIAISYQRMVRAAERWAPAFAGEVYKLAMEDSS
jgi:hypothetical protein